MRAREEHTPSGTGAVRRRPDCVRPRAERLLGVREHYVGSLALSGPGLWRVGAAGGAPRPLGGPPPRAGGEEAVLRWAARSLLMAAIPRAVSDRAVRALAADLPAFAGHDVALTDVEVRVWFLGWQLHGRAAG